MSLIVGPLKETERGPAGVDDKLGGIRCPKCKWRPRRSDRWYCTCQHAWNTFETRGKCPACGFQWTETACIACHAWSLHEEWYARD
jgi:hypothetical protein